MNLMRLGASSVQTAFHLLPKNHIRSFSTYNKPKVPEQITVTFRTSKLFEGKELNSKYVNTKIYEALKEHLPKTIVVKDTYRSAYGSGSTSTIHSQPAASNHDDFFLYYLLFQNQINNNAIYYYHEDISIKDVTSRDYVNSDNDQEKQRTQSSYQIDDNEYSRNEDTGFSSTQDVSDNSYSSDSGSSDSSSD
jgi:hypothetical protein